MLAHVRAQLVVKLGHIRLTPRALPSLSVQGNLSLLQPRCRPRVLRGQDTSLLLPVDLLALQRTEGDLQLADALL